MSSLILSTGKNANQMLVIRKRTENKMRSSIMLCINPENVPWGAVDVQEDS